MNIHELQPGRELDALVAEKLFRWRRETGKDAYGRPFEDILISPDSCTVATAGTEWSGVPAYSTDITAAWDVLYELSLTRIGPEKHPSKDGRSALYKPVIRLEFFEHDGPYECRIGRCKSIDNDDDIVATADERCASEGRTNDEMTVAMCLAICRAALKAVGA